jgi:hypothetical protein
MKTIRVHSPIRLRIKTGAQARDFDPGLHQVSDEELGSWFIQHCIASGRVELVQDAPDSAARPEPSRPSPRKRRKSAPAPAQDAPQGDQGDEQGADAAQDDAPPTEEE